jgi:hypothetical protein
LCTPAHLHVAANLMLLIVRRAIRHFVDIEET